MKSQKPDINQNKIPLFDSSGKKLEHLELDKGVIEKGVNEKLLYQTHIMYAANKRRGTASTKTRADVRGGGKKPWRQKGTGRARVGSTRNPIWRHGGVAFGPHPRDFSYTLPRQLKKHAFFAGICAKLKEGKLIAIESVRFEDPKTKNFVHLAAKLKLDGKTLFLSEGHEKNAVLAARNMKNIALKEVREATALDILLADRVVITKSGLKTLNDISKKIRK